MITEIYLIAVPKGKIGPLLQLQINFLRNKMQETDSSYLFYFSEHAEMRKQLRNLQKCERDDFLRESDKQL